MEVLYWHSSWPHFLKNFFHYFHQVKEIILNNHLTSLGWILILSIIRPFILVPFSLLGMIIAFTYEPLVGIALMNLSAAIGAAAVFLSSRKLSANYRKRFHHNRWLKRLRSHEFETVILARLSMLIHFDLLSLLAGISNISFSTFLAASFLGFVPETIVFEILSLAVKNFKELFIWSPVLIIYFLIIIFIRNKFVQKNNRHIN